MLLVTICFSNVRAEEPILPDIGPKMFTEEDVAAIATDANNTNEAIAEFIRVNAGVSQVVRFLGEIPGMDGDKTARVKFLFEVVSKVGKSNKKFAIDKRFFAPHVQLVLEAGESLGIIYASEGHDVGVSWYVDGGFSSFLAEKVSLETLLSPEMTNGYCLDRIGRSINGESLVFIHPDTGGALMVPLAYFRELPKRGQPLDFKVEVLSDVPLVSWSYKGFDTRNSALDVLDVADVASESNLP